MRSNYKKLGEYIRPIDERNSDGSLGEDNLYGISVTKDFIVTHANLVGVTFNSYKVVEPRQFAYIPDTSRRGDKIAISLNTMGEKIIVSSICTVFEIVDEDQLLPEYLMLWFMRSEFDRYARFMSNGSAREVFDWDCMCGVELPVPLISEQRKIVHVYQVVTNRIELLRKINENLEQQAMAIFNNAIEQSKSITYVELGSLADVKGGKRLPKGAHLMNIPNSHPYIRVRDLNDVVFASLSANYEYVDDETQKTISRYITTTDDVLISIVGTIGLTAIVDKSLNMANLTENCVKVTNLHGISPEYLLLYLRSQHGSEEIKKGTVGAVQAKLPIKNIQALSVPLLPQSDLQSLNDTLKVLFNQLSINVAESKCLTDIRDSLLPKLMSGELDVSNLDL